MDARAAMPRDELMIVTKSEFARRFHDALEAATCYADEQLGRPVPRNFMVWFHGPTYSGRVITPELAIDTLYLGEDRFYLIIDFGVMEVRSRTTTVFVRVSGHPPGSWDQTWNDPPGSGPFKQIQLLTIQVAPEESRVRGAPGL
ncbi:MAG: hypothetical protein U0893_25205 [Chloroflexota bacterium]